MFSRWIEAKSANSQQQQRFLFSPDLLNHQPRFLSSALALIFIAQQLQLQLTLICSSKLPFQLSSLEEELPPNKNKNPKNIANTGLYDSSHISNESKIQYHSTPQWQQLTSIERYDQGWNFSLCPISSSYHSLREGC